MSHGKGCEVTSGSGKAHQRFNAGLMLAMLEQESADREAMIEDQKVAVETEMEAVAAELQAVKEAVSQEIQNSVISLK